MSFICELQKKLIEDKQVYDLSRNQEFSEFNFVGFKETAKTIDFVALIRADKLTEKQIVDLRDSFFNITQTVSYDFGLKPLWRNPNGLLCFIFEDNIANTLINFIKKQSKISNFKRSAVIVSWAIDIKDKQIYTHNNLVSFFPPVYIKKRGGLGVFPGLDYLKSFLRTYNSQSIHINNDTDIPLQSFEKLERKVEEILDIIKNTPKYQTQSYSEDKRISIVIQNIQQNFFDSVYGVAGNVQGNQNIYTSKQNQAHSEVEKMQQAEKQQQKILILSAIPHGLRLDKEIREIEDAIRRAVKRDSFKIIVRPAVRPQDIRRAIADEQPQIVHFCGHGLNNGYLLLEDDGENNKPVAPEALASLFKLHANYVRCVLLNACYSEKPAEAISQHIDYVIGMNNPIQDKAAIEFAKGFYDGLGYKLSDNQDIFQRAFDEGLVAARLESISQGQVPILKKKC